MEKRRSHFKGIQERVSLSTLRYQTMDAGYDYAPIYTQVHQMDQQSVTAYNRRNERDPVGFDRIFHRPVSMNIHIVMTVLTQNMNA